MRINLHIRASIKYMLLISRCLCFGNDDANFVMYENCFLHQFSKHIIHLNPHSLINCDSGFFIQKV